MVDFVKRDYYAAYDETIRNLGPLLLIPNQDPRMIERLDFRPDLPRGSKNLIYLELARLLQSGSSVLRDGFCKNDLFRWLADPRHSNLGASFQTIKDSVYQHIKNGF